MEFAPHVCMYVTKTCYRIKVRLNNSQFTIHIVLSKCYHYIYNMTLHVMCVILEFSSCAFLN